MQSTTAVALLGALCLGGLPARAQDPGASPVAGYERIELRVNTFTYNRQQEASLDADARGNLLIAWGSRRQEAGTYGVFAQHLDPLGRPLGTEIHVNQEVDGHQSEPSVAFAPDGSAWVAWQSSAQDGELGGVYARRLVPQETPEGIRLLPLGPEILLNETISGDQSAPAIEIDDEGIVFASWSSLTREGRALLGRFFHSDGTPLSGEFRIPEDESGHPYNGSIAALGDGRFAVIWVATSEDYAPTGIRGRIFDVDSGAGPEFPVSREGHPHSVDPNLGADAEGNLVAVWMEAREDQDGRYRAMARLFDRNGRARSTAFEVDCGGAFGDYSHAAVAVHPDGRFFVTYNDHQGLDVGERVKDKPDRQVDLRGRFFAADGTPLGEGFVLNAFRPGEQYMQTRPNLRDAVWTGLDQVAVVWNGKTADDGRAIGLTLLASADLEVEAPPAIEPLAACLDLRSEDVDPDGLGYPSYDPNHQLLNLPSPPPASNDFGFNAINDTGWTPPDPDLAVGQNHIVAVVNGRVEAFDKSGNPLWNTTLNAFWASLGSETFVFDPLAMYDHQEDRFIIAASELASDGDYLCFAVSADPFPDNSTTGEWHKYRYKVSPTCVFPDFPNLGSSSTAYVMTTDCFSGGGNNAFIWLKSSVLNGSPYTPIRMNTTGSLISLGCMTNRDANDSTLYFATTYSSASNRVNIKAITDPELSSRQLHSIEVAVNPFSFPPDADQQGSSAKLDTIDWRIKHGVVRNNHLYAVHNTGNGSSANVRWYEFDLRGWPQSGNTPTVVQQGNIDLGSDIDTWHADLAVTPSGCIGIAFNRSSSTEFCSIQRTLHAPSDPAGTVQTPVTLQVGTAADTSGRWGDYSGVEEDPVLPETFWSHLEYPTAGNFWRTWIGSWKCVTDGSNITLQNPVPGFAGMVNDFPVTGATANGTVTYAWSLSTGSSPTGCGSSNWDLANPRIGGTATADAFGNATLTANVPAGAIGRLIHLQALDDSSCTVSNLLSWFWF